jgi:hypothetical protein
VQRFLHFVELERFDDRFDLFHVIPIRDWLIADKSLTRIMPSLLMLALIDPCCLKTQGEDVFRR